MEDEALFLTEELDEYHSLVCREFRYAGPSSFLVWDSQAEFPHLIEFLKQVRKPAKRPSFSIDFVGCIGLALPVLSNEEFMIILPDLVAGCVTSEEFSDVSREVVNRFIDISLRSHEWLEVRPLLTDSFLERLRRGLLEVIPLAWEGRRVGKRSESVNGAFV